MTRMFDMAMADGEFGLHTDNANTISSSNLSECIEVGTVVVSSNADHHMRRYGRSGVINRKEADMGKVVKMSDKEKAARGRNSSGKVSDTDKSRANFSYRLFLIVNLHTFAMIEWLREALEAHSYGDVVRQAVRAFAIRFVENEAMATAECVLGDDSPDSNQKLKRLNIRVPGQTKERLDLLKERTGMDYTDIIVCGLQLLAVRAKDEEAFLSKLESKAQKGATNDEETNFSVNTASQHDLAAC